MRTVSDVLRDSSRPLSFDEILERTGTSESRAFSELQDGYSRGHFDQVGRTEWEYRASRGQADEADVSSYYADKI
jgi:hypothetical protein